jgi:hypothetical protein
MAPAWAKSGLRIGIVIKVYKEPRMINRNSSKVDQAYNSQFTNSSFECTKASGTALTTIPANHPCLKGVMNARCPSWAHGGLPDALRTQTRALDAGKHAWGHRKCMGHLHHDCTYVRDGLINGSHGHQ